MKRFIGSLLFVLIGCNCCIIDPVYAQDSQPKTAVVAFLAGQYVRLAAFNATSAPVGVTLEVRQFPYGYTLKSSTSTLAPNTGAAMDYGILAAEACPQGMRCEIAIRGYTTASIVTPSGTEVLP